MNAQEWFNKGKYYTVFKHQVFVIDSCQGEQNNKPVLCILHGFPTSSFDYWKVIDQLNQHYRVVIHDHVGFGFSDKPIEYSYSLIEQADIALALWKQMGIDEAYLLAHDYGTSVLTEVLVRDNQNCCSLKIRKVALCNGSMHIELAKLKPMQKLLRNQFLGPLVARLASKRTMERNLRDIFVDDTQLDEEEIDAIWHMMTFNQGKRVLAPISRYTFERSKFWHRWIGALKETLIRLEIIWPDSDPIAVAEMANVILNETTNSELHWLKSVGHFPMLEAPDDWAEAVIKHLQQ